MAQPHPVRVHSGSIAWRRPWLELAEEFRIAFRFQDRLYLEALLVRMLAMSSVPHIIRKRYGSGLGPFLAKCSSTEWI